MPATVYEPPLPVIVGASNHDKMEDETFQRLGGAGFHAPPPPLGSGSDDRSQLITWLASVPANTTIGFQPGYLVSAALPLPSGHRYIGRGPAEAGNFHIKLRNGANPAAATTAVVVGKEWDDNTTAGGNPTIYENLAIDGNAANNTGTYSGLIPFSFWTRIVGCRIDNPRLHHVLLTKQMKNGSESSQNHADNRIYNCRFREALAGTDGAGIRQFQPSGAHNADLRVFDNHFESCQHGIWADDAAGWTIFDNHIWARRNGINVDSGWFGLGVNQNYIDSFGEADEAGPFYGIRVKGFGVSRLPTVNGNRISGPDPLPASATGRYWLRIEGGNDNASIGVVGNTAKGPFNNPSANAYGFSFVSASGTLYLTEMANLPQAFNAGKDKEYSGAISYKAPRWVTGTTTWDPASIANGGVATQTLTVTGAAVGDLATAALSTLTAAGSILITARVTAADTVSVTIRNDSGGAVDPASGTLRAVVTKFNG